MFGFAVLLIICLVLPLTYYAAQNKALSDLTGQADTAVAGKAVTDGLNTKAKAMLAQVDPIKAKLKFVDDVHAYARQWIALYNTLAETSPKSSLIYTDASVSGATMTIKAYSPSLEEVGRYLQTMYQEPDFQTVAVDHVPGYPDNVRHLYFLNGVMVFADGASSTSGPGGLGGSGGPGGMGLGSIPSPMGGMGLGGGQSGSGGSSGPSGWGPDQLGPNAGGNIPPGVGPPPAQLTGGAASAPTSGTANPMGGANAQASSGYSPAFLAIAAKDISPFAPPAVREQILQKALSHVIVKEVPKGFDLTVTATLKQALSPPTLPGAQPAGKPGMGGPGGMPDMAMPPLPAARPSV